MRNQKDPHQQFKFRRERFACLDQDNVTVNFNNRALRYEFGLFNLDEVITQRILSRYLIGFKGEVDLFTPLPRLKMSAKLAAYI